MKHQLYSLLLLTTLCIAGCTTPKNVAYFQNAEAIRGMTLQNEQPFRLRPKDKINIVINTADPLLLSQFNLTAATNSMRSLGTTESPLLTMGNSGGSGTAQILAYTVDEQGDISFPVLGKLAVKGKTRQEVAEYLYKKYPLKGEGFLTEMRSKIVSRKSLGQLAVKIGMMELIEHQRGGEGAFKSMGGDALEALIGAVYIEKGYRFTRRIIIRKLLNPAMAIGWPSMMVAICFFGGLIMLFLGMIGEYLGRMFLGMNHQPQFVVREVLTQEILAQRENASVTAPKDSDH